MSTMSKHSIYYYFFFCYRDDTVSKDSLTPPTNSDQVSEMNSKYLV